MSIKAFVLILAIILLLIAVQVCHGYEVSFGYGQDVPVTNWQSEGLDCSVFQIEVSKELRAKWVNITRTSWHGVVVLNLMQGKLNSPQVIDDNYFSGTVTGMAVSSRVILQRTIYDRLYGKLVGGFGVLMGHMPEIGDSGIVGHFGAGVKYVMTNWEIGYEWTHMSDPLRHGDKGWNWQLLTIGWKF